MPTRNGCKCFVTLQSFEIVLRHSPNCRAQFNSSNDYADRKFEDSLARLLCSITMHGPTRTTVFFQQSKSLSCNVDSGSRAVELVNALKLLVVLFVSAFKSSVSIVRNLCVLLASPGSSESRTNGIYPFASFTRCLEDGAVQ